MLKFSSLLFVKSPPPSYSSLFPLKSCIVLFTIFADLCSLYQFYLPPLLFLPLLYFLSRLPANLKGPHMLQNTAFLLPNRSPLFIMVLCNPVHFLCLANMKARALYIDATVEMPLFTLNAAKTINHKKLVLQLANHFKVHLVDALQLFSTSHDSRC